MFGLCCEKLLQVIWDYNMLNIVAAVCNSEFFSKINQQITVNILMTLFSSHI